MAHLSAKYEILRNVFGCSSFRPGQETVIDSILSGRDTLAILPTGGGKSFCYQIPALLFPGVSLVISPLISLIGDQTVRLRRRGVPAAALTSEMSPPAKRQAMAMIRSGGAKLLYLAPERLSAGFLSELPGPDSPGGGVSMVCIDEAHCVSMWGRDFRPAYLRVKDFLEALRRRGQHPVTAAFTATASPRVREDIVRLAGLRDPFLFAAGFDRPNLYYGLIRPDDKYRSLKFLISRRENACGVVYCRTRAGVEAVSARLAADGIPSVRYHAGLPAREKEVSQERFLTGKSSLIVATSAFGMGIDKPDVRYVIHCGMPGDVESYYQETGRAGRDGKPSECIMLADHRDVVVNRSFIAGIRDPSFRELSRENLRAMRRLASGKMCMRHFLLDYFGESSPERCGNCSFCLGRNRRRPPAPKGTPDPELLDDLLDLRRRIAAEKRLPPFRVFPDGVLRDLASARPGRLADLFLLEGVSPAAAIKYGADFLKEIRAWNTCL